MANDDNLPQEDNLTTDTAPHTGEMSGSDAADNAASETSKTETELVELRDKYLRLAAEFDNYKRRTAKERNELFKTANQELMLALLPAIDDFERAKSYTKDTDDTNAVRESIDIIYNKLLKTLQQKGLTPMESIGVAFDPELHEAITQIPAPTPDLKGKVVDEIEKGYYLGDKVMRHAKVVLGQ